MALPDARTSDCRTKLGISDRSISLPPATLYAIYGVALWTRSNTVQSVPVTALQQALRRRLALAVRRERAKRGWTQEVTSERAGLNPRHLQKLEAAELNVTIETLSRLCEAFDVDLPDLFKP